MAEFFKVLHNVYDCFSLHKEQKLFKTVYVYQIGGSSNLIQPRGQLHSHQSIINNIIIIGKYKIIIRIITVLLCKCIF